MARYPDLQKRAREELDAVVGPDRLPTYDDSDSLPYVHAIVMECSRWLPVIPLSMPRRTLTDDYFEDYFIPKGTLIIAVSLDICYNDVDLRDPGHAHRMSGGFSFLVVSEILRHISC